MALADHVVVMNNGRIEDEGPPERVYGQPATRFSATFMGESTILSGRVNNAGEIETALGKFPCSSQGAAGELVHLAIRPENLMLATSGGVRGAVSDVVYQGSFKRVTVCIDNLTLLARLAADADIKQGDSIVLTCDPQRAVILKD